MENFIFLCAGGFIGWMWAVLMIAMRQSDEQS